MNEKIVFPTESMTSTQQWFSNFHMYQNQLEGVLKHGLAGSNFQNFWFSMSGMGLNLYFKTSSQAFQE